MDYKELIDILQNESNPNVLDYIDDAITAITDLLARAESEEARAEKAERERDAAVSEIPKICYYCKHRNGREPCDEWNGSEEAETCEE